MCKQCEKNPVYEFTNKRKLCKNCFIDYFHKKILYTIRKFNMIRREDAVGYKKQDDFKGVVLGNMIDSTSIEIKGLEEYSIYWTKDNYRLSFEKGKSIEILPEQGTGYFLWQPGLSLTKVDLNEIKEINSKGNPNAWYKSEWVEYAGLVAIAAVLVLFFLTSKSMSEMWQ